MTEQNQKKEAPIHVLLVAKEFLTIYCTIKELEEVDGRFLVHVARDFADADILFQARREEFQFIGMMIHDPVEEMIDLLNRWRQTRPIYTIASRPACCRFSIQEELNRFSDWTIELSIEFAKHVIHRLDWKPEEP